MPFIPGLRSPHDKVGRIVLFGRMLDKLRLRARGELPSDFNSGDSVVQQFDSRCCRFLGVPFADIRTRALQGGCDEEILTWAQARGTVRSDEDCVIWNRFVTKLGWRDDRTAVLLPRALEYGLPDARPETLCELFDIDEGRGPGRTRSWEGDPIAVLVVMGVAGCGKSTVGQALATALGWEFLEGDSFHSPENAAKMAAGTPLTDADRAPWLAAIHAAIAAGCARGARLVVACSALRHAYRLALAPDPGAVRFVYLKGDFETLRQRLAGREGHFMKEGMLQSQLATLEEPVAALAVPLADSPDVATKRIRLVLGLA
jgi:carbohydrate kinase (thermoresistant glucokinase family)